MLFFLLKFLEFGYLICQMHQVFRVSWFSTCFIVISKKFCIFVHFPIGEKLEDIRLSNVSKCNVADSFGIKS